MKKLVSFYLKNYIQYVLWHAKALSNTRFKNNTKLKKNYPKLRK